MKVYIHYIHSETDENLNAFIQKKVDKLDTFYDNIIEAEVFLKRANNNTEINSIAELKVKIPGSAPFAVEQAKSYEAAVDACVEAVRKQLKKVKGKQAAQ